MRKAITNFFFTILLFVSIQTNAQQFNEKDFNHLLSIPLDTAQSKLQNSGYEIAHSSLFGHEQLWWNESQNQCIKIKFSKKENHYIESVEQGETDKCIEGVEQARKVWEKYHDGQAPVNTSKINEERKKLTDQGFVVSYWIDEISPGRSSEYWVNETSQKAKFIVWEIQGDVWVMTNNTDYNMGHNPAPKNK